jgi:hypothetical protein
MAVNTSRRLPCRAQRSAVRIGSAPRVWPYLGVCILLGASVCFCGERTLQQQSPPFPYGAQLLPDAELRRLARFIAAELEILRAPQGLQSAPLSAAEVAKQYGLSRGWVYKHARELGGQRMGSGPKARLRFCADEVHRRLAERQVGQTEAARPEARDASGRVELLPVGPRRRTARQTVAQSR